MGVPSGWKLVPVEPTTEMVIAAYSAQGEATSSACESIYRAMLAAVPAAPAAQALTDGDTLWLWRNGDHFLAFRHLYPCYSPGGDPMTLGEPFGRAEFRSSFDRAAPAAAEQASAVQAVNALNTWRPVRLEFGVTMHRDHNPPSGGEWLKKDEVLAAVAGAAQAAEKADLMFWVRLLSDGGYEGPIHNDSIERVRKLSGVWHPLYLHTAPPAPARQEWQPIETAPRDGTLILVNDTTPGGTPWVAAVWLDAGEWRGWSYDSELDRDANPLGPRPTHWMPITAAPAEGEKR